MAAARNIFFIRTTHELALSPVELCSVASAALKNPTWRINLLSNSLPCDGGFVLPDGAPAGSALANVYVVRFNFTDVFAPLPHMSTWFDSRAWDAKYRDSILSDALRLALLWRFGGMYMDTDVLNLRSVEGLVNSVVAEDPWMINNAWLAFSAGHEFVAAASVEYVAGFNADWWGWNGPRLITRMWWRYSGGRHNNVLLLPIVEAYPVTWRDVDVLFEPVATHTLEARRILEHSRVVHLFNRESSSRLAELAAQATPSTPRDLLVHLLMDAACPILQPRAAVGAAVVTGGIGGSAGTERTPLQVRHPAFPGESFSMTPAAGTFTRDNWLQASVSRMQRIGTGMNAVSVQELANAAADMWQALQLRPTLHVSAGRAMKCPGTACAGDVASSSTFTWTLPPTAATVAPPRAGGGGAPATPPVRLQVLPVHVNHTARLGRSSDGSVLWNGLLAPCGVVLPGAVGVLSHLAFSLPAPQPSGSDFLFSFWLASRTLDFSLREWPHHTPDIDPAALPNRDLRIPAIRVPLDVLSSLLGVPPDSAAASIIIAVEDGHLTVGSVEAEWLRSTAPVADLHWHHVSVSVERVPSTSQVYMARVSLFIDALLNMHTDVSLPAAAGASASWARAVIGDVQIIQHADKPLVYVDEVATFALGDVIGGEQRERRPKGAPPATRADVPPAPTQEGTGSGSVDAVLPARKPRVSMPWTQDLAMRIRNAQVLAQARRPCTPFASDGDGAPAPALSRGPLQVMRAPGAMVWDFPQRRRRQLGDSGIDEPSTLALVLSDGRPASVRLRMACRLGWAQLARTVPMRHYFVLTEHDRLAVAHESAVYDDILFVPASDDYRQLSQKVMAAFRAVLETPEAQSGRVDFVIKTDHDVMLHVAELHKELSGTVRDHVESGATGSGGDTMRLRHWRGFVYRAIPPLRDLSDKNADVTSIVSTFPPYTAGVAYIMSLDVVRDWAAIASPIFTLNEDQNTGLWALQADQARMATRWDGGQAAASLPMEPPLEPVHDTRFQQWAVCRDEQLAVHLSDQAKPKMRLLTYNLERGRALCRDSGLSTCCLCCKCSEAPFLSWFACNQQGASLSEFISLEEITHVPLQSILAVHSVAELRQMLAVVNEAYGERAPQATNHPYCPWRLQEWLPRGPARVTVSRRRALPATMLALSASNSRPAVSEYDMVGIALSCPTAPECSPPDHSHQRQWPWPRQCAVEVRVVPPQPHECDLAMPPPTVRGNATSQWCWDSAEGFGRVQHGAATCDPVPRSALDDPSVSQPPLLGRQPSQGGPHLEWLLLAGVVDTSGVCVPPRDDPGDVPPPSALDRRYMSYPRFGAFLAFCGIVVDLQHADGLVTSLRVPFARNATVHVLHEPLRVAHMAPVVDATLTVIMPVWPHTPANAAMFLSDLELLWLATTPADTPPRSLSPKAWAAAMSLKDSDPRGCDPGGRSGTERAADACSNRMQALMQRTFNESRWMFVCSHLVSPLPDLPPPSQTDGLTPALALLAGVCACVTLAVMLRQRHLWWPAARMLVHRWLGGKRSPGGAPGPRLPTAKVGSAAPVAIPAATRSISKVE